jgi:peroxiredoxin Q/BCP
MTLEKGDLAPDFTLADQHGESHRLSDYQGQWVLVYFYPRDDTPGCTKEACAIRDNFAEFQAANAKVLGISTDTVASHEKFAAKYDLPFTLLADEGQEVVKLYDVWGEKSSFGKKYFGTKRMSFLVDQEGKIAKVYKTVKPAGHARQVLGDIAALAGG